MIYSTDKGREQIAAQRRVKSMRKKRRLGLAAPALFVACKAALSGYEPYPGYIKTMLSQAIVKADQDRPG